MNMVTNDSRVSITPKMDHTVVCLMMMMIMIMMPNLSKYSTYIYDLLALMESFACHTDCSVKLIEQHKKNMSAEIINNDILACN
jgi:hypothetical protein